MDGDSQQSYTVLYLIFFILLNLTVSANNYFGKRTVSTESKVSYILLQKKPKLNLSIFPGAPVGIGKILSNGPGSNLQKIPYKYFFYANKIFNGMQFPKTYVSFGEKSVCGSISTEIVKVIETATRICSESKISSGFTTVPEDFQCSKNSGAKISGVQRLSVPVPKISSEKPQKISKNIHSKICVITNKTVNRHYKSLKLVSKICRGK